MIQLTRPKLSATATKQLKQYQEAVDEQGDYLACVQFAKKDFSKKNKKGNTTFDEIKERLVAMCSGAERCHYCEDSKADEVEHLLPKDVYPDLCYKWEKYLYSCGGCNRDKSNHCAVIVNGNKLVDLTPSKKKKNPPPRLRPDLFPSSVVAMIDPVLENPLDFFLLDIQMGTFELSVLHNEGTVKYIRAKYTLDVLKLDQKPFLRQARENAYGNYKRRLQTYIAKRDTNARPTALNRMITELQTEVHPTVWKEMQRQYGSIVELTQLFQQAPEALNW
jgi:uncharacterized protein (TIGR02646 family)